MRRWVVRAGLVLAGGAAALAFTSGSASADSGLGGTLHEVSSTVKKVTGASHGSHPSGSSHSSSSAQTSSHRSAATATHRVVRHAVVKPVARTLHRTVEPLVRPTSHPARRVSHAVSKPTAKPQVSHHLAPKRARTERSAPKAHRVRSAKVAVTLPGLDVPVLGRATDLARVGVRLLPLDADVDLGGLSVRLTLPVGVDVRLPDPVVTFPPLPGLPPVPGTPALANGAAPTADRSTHEAAQTSPASHAGGVTASRPVAVLAGTALAHASPDVARTAAHAVDQAASARLGLPTMADAVGSVVGGVPAAGSASSGAAGGLVLGLAAMAVLAGLGSARVLPVTLRSDRAARLPRQPGFAPD